jgi:hypothetical protein
VTKLRRAMKHGTYRLNGATVCRTTSGRLIDGQNRLQAIVMSGITQPIIEISGLTEESMDTIDLGKGRSVADIIVAKGVHIPSVHFCVSTGSILMLGGTPELKEAGRDRTEVAHYVIDHQDRLLDCVRWATNVSHKSPRTMEDKYTTRRPILSVAPLAALSIIMENQGVEQVRVRHFFELIGVHKISDIPAKDQKFVEAVRNWMVKKYPLIREGGSQFSGMLRVMSTLITVFNVMQNPRMSYEDKIRCLRLAQHTITSYEHRHFNRATIRP